jgi:hypothetical protein
MNIKTLEKLQQLDDLRLETMVSPAFQEWTNSLNVSRLAPNPEPLANARQMNKEYNYSSKNKVAGLIKRLYL